MPVFVIARLAIREATRRRLLIALAVLTLVAIAFTAWGFYKLTTIPCRGQEPCSQIEVRALAATLVILVSFMFSFVFTVGAVFVSVPAISSEVESGVLLAMLPRPLRRSDIVIGKWLGLGLLVAGYTVITMGLEFLAVELVTGYLPPYPGIAIGFMAAESLVMLTLALLASTRVAPMTGGIIALVLFGLAWMGGIARAIGAALGSDVVRDVGTVTSIVLPTDGLWRGALYHLEPTVLMEAAGMNRMLAANPFFTLNAPSSDYLLWAAAWVAGMLVLAVWSFQRREL
jgi:ABC-type transport system involved in multi-copper enzyme maturation permease subunit